MFKRNEVSSYDERNKWLANEIGGLSGKSVLELGPLEGGHTYMLEQLGATDITSVEANARAFLKCLIIEAVVQSSASALFVW